MVKIFIPIVALLMAGCSTYTSVCPEFPKPTQEVLNEIKSLNNLEVDNWVIELYKLNKKLEICKGE